MEKRRNEKTLEYINGIGILCNIPAKNIKVLITYNNIIDLYILNEVKELSILIDDKERKIDMTINRYKYINENITIIEILDVDDIKSFIEIDKFINSKNYVKNNIIIISLDSEVNENLELQDGKILSKDNENYLCKISNIESIKSEGVILLKKNLTLIGFIKGNNNKNEIEIIPMNIIINKINNAECASNIILVSSLMRKEIILLIKY